MFSEYYNYIDKSIIPDTCCDDQVLENGTCINCCSMVETLYFCEDLELNYLRESYQSRKKKFQNFLVSRGVNSFCFVSLMDVFPKVENSFRASSRTNFVNMDQLVRELLPLIGYSEYLDKFPPLKTKIRIKEVREIVKNIFVDCENGVGVRLEDIPLIELKLPYDLDLSKITLDHTYSDLNSIEKMVKPPPKPKPKPKPRSKPKPKKDSCCGSCSKGGKCESKKSKFDVSKLIKTTF